MKKILALMLAVLLCVSVMAVTASAAGSATLYVGSASGNRGDEVTVNVSLSGNEAMAGLYIEGFEYDKTRLSLVDYSTSSFGDGTWTGSLPFMTWDAAADTDYNGTVLSLTFKILENAPYGDADVTVTASAGNWDLEMLFEDDFTGIITVVEPETPACDHKNATSKVTKEATCTESGTMTWTCECGHSWTEEIAALGHKHEAVVTDATCTEGGYTTYTCSRCGDSYTDDETEALGHKWNNGEVTKEPTKDTEGVMTYTCERCGETKTESIPALGGCTEHKWNFNDLHVTLEPTCTEPGEGYVVCSECGEKMNVDLDALGHDWSEWEEVDEDEHERTCGRCGETETEDHTWAENDPDHCWKCGYDKPEKSDDGKDDVLKTGDITPYITFTAAALIAMVAAAGYIFKRNFIK